MFGLTFEKLLVIGVIAAFIIGPERLPQAAEKLAQAVRWVRGQAQDAKGRLREEMGDEFDDVDWRKLDPRQYDPRRIIRDALLEDDWGQRPAAGATAAVAGAASAAAAGGAASAAARGSSAPQPDPQTEPAAGSRPSWATTAAAPEVAAADPSARAAAPFDVEAT